MPTPPLNERARRIEQHRLSVTPLAAEEDEQPSTKSGDRNPREHQTVPCDHLADVEVGSSPDGCVANVERRAAVATLDEVGPPRREERQHDQEQDGHGSNASLGAIQFHPLKLGQGVGDARPGGPGSLPRASLSRAPPPPAIAQPLTRKHWSPERLARITEGTAPGTSDARSLKATRPGIRTNGVLPCLAGPDSSKRLSGGANHNRDGASRTKHSLAYRLANDVGENRAHTLVSVLPDLFHDLLEARLGNARARSLADKIVETLLE